MNKAQKITAHQNPNTEKRYTEVNGEYREVKIFPTDNGLVWRLYKLLPGQETTAEMNINQYPGEAITTETPLW